MSTDLQSAGALTFHLGDRLRKSLEAADVTVGEMADYLGVNRNSVSAWINLRRPPSKQTMRLWAMRTGVPLVWLETGHEDRPGMLTHMSDDPRAKTVPAEWQGPLHMWTLTLRAAGKSDQTVTLRRAHVAQLARAVGGSPESLGVDWSA